MNLIQVVVSPPFKYIDQFILNIDKFGRNSLQKLECYEG